MTPGLDWRARYAGRPALAKLEYCDRVMADLRGREPLVTAEDPDEDVGGLDVTLDEFYRAVRLGTRRTRRPTWTTPCSRYSAIPPTGRSGRGRPAAALDPPAGADHRRRRVPLDRLVPRAGAASAAAAGRPGGAASGLTYPEARETAATVALTAFVTALAMSRVQRSDGASVMRAGVTALGRFRRTLVRSQASSAIRLISVA